MAQVFGQNGRAIADVETTTHQDEATANARLIAAAPDLLEVFSEVLEKIDFDKGAKGGGFEDEAELLLIRARAAIAKATGAA